MQFFLTETQRDLVESIRWRMQSKVWVVGGAVRDSLLGKPPKDIDFVTDASPDKIAKAGYYAGIFEIPDKTAFAHGIVRFPDRDTKQIIDVASLRQDTNCDGRYAVIEFTDKIELDLARRDLTINAIAVEIDKYGQGKGLIDPFEGQQDLAAHVIRFVGDPRLRIKEDYLRMLRACRFTALGEDWHLTQDAVEAIRESNSKITTVSAERLHDEVLKAMGYSKPSAFIRSLNDCHLLGYVIPDVARCFDVDGGSHHAECVGDHLCFSVDHTDQTDKALFRLAVLLHDIGKADTKKEKDGEVTFYNHEVVGTRLAEQWMKSLKFSNDEIAYVTKLVRHHMFYFTEESTDKTIRKWLNKVGKEDWKDLIRLRICDRKGNRKKEGRSEMTTALVGLLERIDNIFKDGAPIFKEDLAINGDDIRELGLKPGPEYKLIFDNMLGIVISDPSRNTREWLLNYVQRNWIKEKK